MATILNEATFNQAVANGKVLVDFYADWCGPCKMMAPIVDEFAKENANVAVYKVNVDECPNISRQYGIVSIPTFIVFENGEAVKKALGAMPKEQLEEMVK